MRRRRYNVTVPGAVFNSAQRFVEVVDQLTARQVKRC